MSRLTSSYLAHRPPRLPSVSRLPLSEQIYLIMVPFVLTTTSVSPAKSVYEVQDRYHLFVTIKLKTHQLLFDYKDLFFSGL